MASDRDGAKDKPFSPLRFSFKYLDTAHPAFDMRRCTAGYYVRLLQRLRDLSGLTVGEFRMRWSKATRVHRIDFADDPVSVRSFGVHGVPADERAWQFSVSANEHGRVHGFLMGDTFFIRWLDPEHNLYARN